MIHFNFKIIVKKSLLAIEQVIFMNSKNELYLLFKNHLHYSIQLILIVIG